MSEKHSLDGANVLEALNLKKIYGQRTVVKDVSLRLHSGEVVGLLGPNGAGKTTTFYMIVGLVASNGGQILLNGESIQHLPIYKRARIGITYRLRKTAYFVHSPSKKIFRQFWSFRLIRDGSAHFKETNQGRA